MASFFWNTVLLYILSCVATPGKPNPPTVIHIGIWSITVSYKPPPGADKTKVIIYVIRYRKQGQTDWVSLPGTTTTTVTITHLQGKTHYVIVVAAQYKEGELGPDSDPAIAETRPGKYIKTS